MQASAVFDEVRCRLGGRPPFETGVSVTGDGLVMDGGQALFFRDVDGIVQTGHALSLRAGGETVLFDRLGYELEAFRAALYRGYNDYLLRGFYSGESVEFRCPGEYALGECRGPAEIRLYPSSLCVMPEDETPLRFPLCFIRETGREGYDAHITDDLGRTIHVLRLGYEQDAFHFQLDRLRDRQYQSTRTRLLGLWDWRNMNADGAASLLLEGNCAALNRLEDVSPGFSAAFDRYASQLPARDEYAFLRRLGGGDTAVGVLRTATAEKPAVWLAVPLGGGRAAVEIMEDGDPDAATYLYDAPDFPAFLQTVSHAMEAVDYRRDPLRAVEGGTGPGGERLALALRLSPSLAALRGAYAGRAIHRSFDGWKRAVLQSTSQGGSHGGL